MKVKFPLLAVSTVICFFSCDTKAKENESKESNISTSLPIFVTGLKKSEIYTSADTTDYGSFIFNYKFNSGRKFEVKYWDDQGEYVFRTVDETKEYEDLDAKFDLGLGESGLTPTAKVQIGQYDFDGDDIDELVISVQENKSGADCLNGISFNIFKLKKGKWYRIGNFTAECIVGDGIPKADIKVNKITVQRNLRGFYYQWTFVNDKFENTSSL